MPIKIKYTKQQHNAGLKARLLARVFKYLGFGLFRWLPATHQIRSTTKKELTLSGKANYFQAWYLKYRFYSTDDRAIVKPIK